MSNGMQTEDIAAIPLVFTAKEAAKYLRFSEATILRLAHQGFIPGSKIGRQWRFSRESILNLVKSPEFIPPKAQVKL